MSNQIHLTLAPLRGVTDSVFRCAYARRFGGFDDAVAPFVTTVRGREVAPSHLRDLELSRNHLMPVVPQILGNDVEELMHMVHAFERMGYTRVDWNLGCPFVKVTRKKRGSGLLPFPDRIISILDSLLPSIRSSLSLKVRLGVENERDLEQLLPRLAPYPIHSVTIHARTASDMYEAPVRLDAFERCLALTGHTVAYNGDITTPGGFVSLKARFGSRVHSWMIGRGAIENPFLAMEIHGAPLPLRSAQVEAIRGFHDDIFSAALDTLPGPAVILGRMKELWRLLGRWFESDGHLTGKLCRTTSPGTYQEAVHRLFDIAG